MGNEVLRWDENSGGLLLSRIPNDDRQNHSLLYAQGPQKANSSQTANCRFSVQ